MSHGKGGCSRASDFLEETLADQQRDVIEVLEQDHREVEAMFAELESLRGAATEEARSRRKAVTEQVTIEPRMAAGPAASLFDRMRDLATGRGTSD